MSPRLSVLCVYLLIGFAEWFLAMSRTAACAQRKWKLMASIVFVENLLGLYVLQNFISSNDWTIAATYSLGGAAGAMCVAKFFEKKECKK